MLETLTEAQLNEVLETEGNNYDVVDLMPKAKTPQMFLLKGDGIDNLVVRLMAQKEGGDTLRNLMPNDKNVVVFIMTLNDKGNLAELKGGLGANPLKALTTIFDTVYSAIKPSVVETVMFRFPAKKMAGQERGIRRVLERLIQVRGKNRFVVLSEMASFSAKYSYVVAHKRNLELTDIPGASIDTERYKKVDTKVGEVYIDNETGKDVSKAEAIAQAVSTAVSKLTTQSVIAKSKISRREAMAAMYSSSEFSGKPDARRQKYDDSHAVVPATGNKTLIQQNINNIDLKSIGQTLMEYEHATWEDETKSRIAITPIRNIVVPMINDVFGHRSTSKEGKAMASNIIRGIGTIIADANPKDLQSMMVKISEFISTTSFGELDKTGRINFARGIIFGLLNGPIGGRIRIAYEDDEAEHKIRRQYTEDQVEAIKAYTGSDFSDINGFLIGHYGTYPGLEETIAHLDEAFKNGTTLERGTILYRGQSVKYGQMKSIMDTKMMYFRNFVSTSLYPVIYGGFANAVANIEPTAQDQTHFTSADLSKSTSYTSDAHDAMNAGTIEDSNYSVSVAMVIKGADKINVIVPGNMSSYPNECEVILPRGTILKINKVVGESFDFGDSNNSMLMETTVVGPDQIDENTEMYDGDLFLSEGRLEVIKPSIGAFYNNEVINEAVIPNNDDATSILLSLIDFTGMPQKFID
ncbi:Alt-like RNA polymerase ADP-ribosyltransferase [Acinetobacter phage vB_AbaM_AB-Navy-v2]|nr:ADP ribosyltransferase [Acinetobacter phage AC4]